MEPISVALDAFAVKALLTTVSKQAAKRSAATTKMANTAKGTVMEGELASRAAAELKVAQELERTVKYEGKLVWDDALGAYVPESSVVKPKIDAEEVAPVVAAIEDAVPNNNPAVANVADDADLPGPFVSAVDDVVDTDTRALNALKAEYEFSKRNIDNPISLSLGDKGVVPVASAYDLDIVNNHPAKIAALEAKIAKAAEAAKVGEELKSAWLTGADDFFSSVKGNDGMLAATRNQEVAPALAAQADDIAATARRTSDDAAMAAAVQDDLFKNASPAAYENYQASRMAALADDTALATAAPKGMITSRAAGPISRTKDIDIPPPPSVPRLTAKPESASRPAKDLEINLSRTLPAAQRIAAAASQTGLQGERGADGSFLPELPDRGIDIDQSIGASIPEPAPVEIIKSSEKPGWYQGVSKDDDDDGNYWSADFEDEHWNTPAGVQEAIGIWGRPIGNRIGQRFN